MHSDEGAKELIHEWRPYKFYVNRADHGKAHVHIYLHNHLNCEYYLESLKLRKGHPSEELHNYVQSWGYRNMEANMADWRRIAGAPPHASNPTPPMTSEQRRRRRRKRKRK